MAKMKIYEIARSIQQQDKNIKSGDFRPRGPQPLWEERHK